MGTLLTPQSQLCPHRLVCPGASSCSSSYPASQLSGVDSSDAKMPKNEHSSDPGCGVTFDRASWRPFYAPIGGTFFHSTWDRTSSNSICPLQNRLRVFNHDGDLNCNPRFRFVLASAVAVVIFRGELALLLGTAAAADLFVGRKIRFEIKVFIC